MLVLVSRKEKLLGNGLGRTSRKHIEDNSQASFVSYRFVEKNVHLEGDRVLVHPESNALGKERSVYARNIQAQEPDQHHHARNDVPGRKPEEQALENNHHYVRGTRLCAIKGGVPVPSEEEQQHILQSNRQGKQNQLDKG
jgi:hypothetical protein